MKTNETKPVPQFVSQAGLARLCNVTYVTAYRWTKQGRIRPTAQLDGRVPLFDLEEAEAFADVATRASTPDKKDGD